MNNAEIDAVIGQAQQIKRRGQVARATSSLENLLNTCQCDGTHVYSLAPIYKSLAKLYYIQRDFSKARSSYIEAITLYTSGRNEEEAAICIAHLGFCSDEFIKSKFLNQYILALQTGADVTIPQEVVGKTSQYGVEMYSNWRNQSASNNAQQSSYSFSSRPQREHSSMDITYFGSDFLWLTKELRIRGNKDTADNFDDAVAKFLLFEWGLTPEGVDESHRIFWQRFERGALGDFADALKRLLSVFNENEDRKAHLVRDLAAIIQTQRSDFTDQQKAFINGFQELFDMKPSEFQAALERGGHLADALQFVGHAYANSSRP